MDSEREYEAAVREVALFDLGTVGMLEFAGPDRTDFLHRLLASDVQALRPGQGQPSLLLDPRGKILATLRLYAAEDSLFVLTEPNLPERILAALRRYLFSERIEMRDRSAEFGALALLGPRSAELLEACGPRSLPSKPDAFTTADLGSPLRILRSAELGIEGFVLLVQAADAGRLAKALFERGRSFGLRRAGRETWELLRTEAGLPRLGVEIDETFYPQEAGLDAYFSLGKGCFPGQETVARMQAYGSPPKRLVGLIFEEEESVPPRTPITRDGEEVGWTASWRRSWRLRRPIGLGFLKRGKEFLDREFEMPSGSTVRAISLPFLR